MSVTVKFWSFSKRKNSTLIPTASPSYSYDCQIKAETTLINPVIELNTDQAKGCNYAQITDFGRYYFIRDWTFDRGLWTASLEEDVLASYKSEIGSQTMYVARSASSYDGDIKDMFYPTTSVCTGSDTVISNSTIGNTDPAARTFTDGYFILGILGNNTASAATTFYQMSPTMFQSFLSQIFVAVDGYDFGDLTIGIYNSLVNPTQYITSCRWVPYAFPGTALTGEISLGLWSTSGFSGSVTVLNGEYTARTFSVTIPKHPKASARGSYMNLAPYSNYWLEWGQLYPLDSSLIAKESTLNIWLGMDPTSREGIIEVYGGTVISGKPILSASIPYAVDIPMAQSNVDPAALVDIGKNVAAVGASIATGNALGVIAGTASAIMGSVEAGSNVTSIGSLSAGYMTAARPKRLKAAFYDVVDDDLADFGRPLMKKKQISTLSGFVRCQNDDVSIACLDPERESIRAFMTGGFFYE